MINELKQIRNYVKQHYLSTINDLIKSVEEHNQNVDLIVPPLVSDFPLSYRSGEQNLVQSKLSSVQTTATPIIGVVQGSLSNEQEAGYVLFIHYFLNYFLYSFFNLVQNIM